MSELDASIAAMQEYLVEAKYNAPRGTRYRGKHRIPRERRHVWRSVGQWVWHGFELQGEQIARSYGLDVSQRKAG